MGVGSTLPLAYELKILQVTQDRSTAFKITQTSMAQTWTWVGSTHGLGWVGLA